MAIESSIQEVKRIEKNQKEEKKTIVEKAKEIITPKEKKKEEKIIAEKILTIGLRKIIDISKRQRASAAIKLIKKRVERIVKKPTKINLKLNEAIWARGIEKPPKKIKVKVIVKENKAEIIPA